MSIIASALVLSIPAQIANGFSLDAGLWAGVALFAASAIPRPGPLRLRDGARLRSGRCSDVARPRRSLTSPPPWQRPSHSRASV